MALCGGLNRNDTVTARREDDTDQERSKSTSIEDECVSQATGTNSGTINLNNSSDTTSTTVLQGTTKKEDCLGCLRQLQQVSTSRPRGERGTDMVDTDDQISEWPDYKASNTRYGDIHRCVPCGLGCGKQSNPDWRCMDRSREVPSHQLSRTSGSMVCHPSFHKRPNGSEHSPLDGQPFSDSIHQQYGGDTINSVSKDGDQLLVVGPEEGDIHPGKAHCRQGECSSRQNVEKSPRPFRLEVESVCFQQDQSSLGSTSSGSLCYLVVNTTPKVLHLGTGTHGRSSRCLSPGLDSGEGVCESSILPFYQVSTVHTPHILVKCHYVSSFPHVGSSKQNSSCTIGLL